MFSPDQLPTPKPFDVLFTASKVEAQSVGLIVLQPFIDKKASGARKRFSHAAIVVDGQFALESVPTEEGGSFGEFTGASLEPGVRFVPLPDILVPALKRGARFAVMRSRQAHRIAPEKFNIFSPQILRTIGSEYSLKNIQDSFEARFQALPKPALDFLRRKFDMKSPKNDIGNRSVRKEVREELERLIPGYKFPFESCSYFCSKMVVDLLIRNGLFPPGENIDFVSPSGLFARLNALEDWQEVTESDYGKDRLEAIKQLSPETWLTEYWERKAELQAAIGLLSIKIAIETQNAADQAKADRLEEILRLANRLGLDDPLRQVARLHESELITSLTDALKITAKTERERFGAAAHDGIRMFGMGLLSHEELFQWLAKAMLKKSDSTLSA